MTTNVESDIMVLRLWRQLYQTYTLLKQCEDRIIEEHGLTTEQYAILVSISYVGEPARVTDIAHWLERSTNSISMIVDRMVKVGLVKRTRSKADRRVVYVAFASKGENALKPSSRAMFETVRKHMSPLSQQDRSTLLSLLATLGHEILVCLNPEIDLEAVKKEETKQVAGARKWLSKYVLSSTPQAKRRAGGKKKTARRG
jgi:MarR family transcriptional regulator, organic hydroperoxide resistance regulator